MHLSGYSKHAIAYKTDAKKWVIIDGPAKGKNATVLGTYWQTLVPWIVPKGDGWWNLTDINCSGKQKLLLTSVSVSVL